MKHNEYLKQYEPLILDLEEVKLFFWNLWCLNYAVERISKDDRDYENLTSAYLGLWNYYENNFQNLDQLMEKSFVNTILQFDQDDFENLDDFDVKEKSKKELIIGLESMFSNLLDEEKIIYNAYECPINIIDVEIDGISISTENTNRIYLSEIEAQKKLLDELNSNKEFNYADRNIFRIG